MNPPDIHTFMTREGTSVEYIGPPLEIGPLPSFVYFALTALESLTTPPFALPALFAYEKGFRVFSVTLPLHYPHEHHTLAIKRWAEALERGEPIIDQFLEQVEKAVEELEENGYLLPGKTAVGGLSRGGLVATHLAARKEIFSHLLAYAPLTSFTYLDEFSPYKSYNLETLIPKLLEKKVRFHIGNRDTRVGTAACFQFITALADAMYAEGKRSPQAEVMIYPSIGFRGHGTSDKSFKEGIVWLQELFF